MFNPLGMPKHPRSIEESESWIRDAKAREDAVEDWKLFFWAVLWFAGLVFGIWTIARLFV